MANLAGRGAVLALVSLLTSCSTGGYPDVIEDIPDQPLSAFVGVTVLPMDGGPRLERHTVAVRDGRIIAVAPDDEIRLPADATRLGRPGQFVIPGLADMHVHYGFADDGILFLARGVTTVRNMWGASETPWEEYYAALYSYKDALKMRQSLREHFLYLNDEATVELTHGHYLVGTFKAGTGNEYPGVDAKVAWYNRNLRIFANIQRMTEGPDDRILVIIGSGHLPVLRHAIESSPEYTLVEVADVLSDGCGQPAIREDSRTSFKD